MWTLYEVVLVKLEAAENLYAQTGTTGSGTVVGPSSAGLARCRHTRAIWVLVTLTVECHESVICDGYVEIN